MIGEFAAALSWDDIRLGVGRDFEFVITVEDMANFAALSGDFNPLHQDPTFAQARGFDDCVVYGALIIAKISRMLGMMLPGRSALWTGLDIQFRRPLYIGQRAQLKAAVDAKSDAVKMIVIKVEISSEAGRIATAKCETLFEN